MSTTEKIVYFLTMVILYAVLIVTALQVPTDSLEYAAIVLSVVETVHWGYGMKHRKIGMFFWGGLVVVATVVMTLKASFGILIK